MQRAGLSIKSLILTFLAALVFYIIAYNWLTGRQTNRGPWQVLYTNDASGRALLVIDQPQLAVTNVRISVPELSVTNHGLVRFSTPNREVPYGKVIFDDLMFQPGTVTLDLDGHEIELLPRTLVVNERQIPWQPGLQLELQPTNRLSEAARAAKGKKTGYKEKDLKTR